MADFHGHVTAATIASGLGGASLLVTGLSGVEGVLLCFAAGILGGVLPDIDADDSIPLELAFSFVSTAFAFLVVFALASRLTVVELLLLGFACAAFVKRVVFRLFNRLTVHRGLIHSIPAGLLFSFGFTASLHSLLGFSPRLSWLAGGFLLLGYWLHLVVDELYGLNLFGTGGAKRSSGRALKWHSSNWLATLALYAAVVGAFFLTPDSQGLLADIFRDETLRGIRTRFVPEGSWFAPLWRGREVTW
ncbi:MAG: metal-dependent hydrolase [Magnetococcales bacterium]|nr:metal-dependent hydrolase [Magnetococcales bacterium]MBF0156193.1 metal-dependent hydrolase [Magnetococcales bacterium]